MRATRQPSGKFVWRRILEETQKNIVSDGTRFKGVARVFEITKSPLGMTMCLLSVYDTLRRNSKRVSKIYSSTLVPTSSRLDLSVVSTT